MTHRQVDDQLRVGAGSSLSGQLCCRWRPRDQRHRRRCPCLEGHYGSHVPTESTTRLMLRVRDTIDRHYAEPLDLERLAGVAHLSPSHVVADSRWRSVRHRTSTSIVDGSNERNGCCVLRTTPSLRSRSRWGMTASARSPVRFVGWSGKRRPGIDLAARSRRRQPASCAPGPARSNRAISEKTPAPGRF